MQSVTFARDMVKTGKLVRISTLGLLVISLIAGLMFFFGRKPWYLVVEFFTAIALVIFFMTLAFLLSSFLTRTEVKQKRSLVSQRNQLEKEISLGRQTLAEARQKLERVRIEYRDLQQAEVYRYNTLTDQLNQQVQALQAAEQQERTRTLEQLQKDHIETGLKAVPLDPAHVPGIGPALFEKLTSAGLVTAADISNEQIVAIPGFGESKALSLVRWRESLENSLRATQPLELPLETQDAITQHYAPQILAVQNELAAAHTAHASALEDLRNREAASASSAAEAETVAQKTLLIVEAQEKEAQEQLGQYTQIHFARYLFAVLNGDQTGWNQRVASYLLWLVFFAAGVANVVLLIAALVGSRL